MPRKPVSYKNFKKRFDERAGEEYEYLGGYVEMSKHIRVKCLKCQYEFSPIASNFIGSKNVIPTNCKMCNILNLRSQEKEKFVSLLQDEGYILQDEYINQSSDIHLYHMFCGNIWRTRAEFFLRGTRCPHCSNEGNRKNTSKILFKEAKKELEGLHDRINVIGEAEQTEKYETQVKIQFKTCNHIVQKTVSYLKQRESFECPVCKQNELRTKKEQLQAQKNQTYITYLEDRGYKNIKIDNDQIICEHSCNSRNIIPKRKYKTWKCICEKQVTNTEICREKIDFLSKGDCELIGEYVNKGTKILVKNKNCQHTYPIKMETFYRSQACRICTPITLYRNHPYTIDELQEEIDQRYGKNTIKILSRDYKNLTTPIQILHSCNKKSFVTPDHLLHNKKVKYYYCIHCAKPKSTGERLIKEYLKKNNFIFIAEHSFKDCRHKKPLRFDFVVFNSDNTIKLIVERDGLQHSEYGNPLCKTKEDLELIKKRDEIKNNYCKKNNYPLVRISYKDNQKIEEILSRELLK